MESVTTELDPKTVRPLAGADRIDWLLSCHGVSLLSIVLAIADARLMHWFILPVTCCGVLIGVDLSAAFRRRIDLFDPRGMLGLLGFHFFYLAPILHVMLDYWQPRLAQPSDWRYALGLLAVVNAAGLIIYRVVMAQPSRRPRLPGRVRRGPMRLDEGRFLVLGSAAVLVGAGSFIAQLVRLGGPAGYLATVTQGQGFAMESLRDMSLLVLLGDTFPLLIFAMILIRWRATLAGHWTAVVGLLLGLAVLQLLVSGLRGSRSSTVWPVLIGLILIHLLVRPVPRKAVLVFVVTTVAFLYFYGFYKKEGVDGLDVVRGTRTVEEVSADTGRDMPLTILGDLARSDVQATLLDKTLRGEGTRGDGVTYLGAIALLVPRSLVPTRPPTKTLYGTEVLLGPGVFDFEAGRWSSKVYGMVGEGLLNFGPIGGLLCFLPFALLMRFARRVYARARDRPHLAAKLLAPSIAVAAVLCVSGDSDNIVMFAVARCAPLALIVALSLVRSTSTTVTNDVAGQRAGPRELTMAG